MSFKAMLLIIGLIINGIQHIIALENPKISQLISIEKPENAKDPEKVTKEGEENKNIPIHTDGVSPLQISLIISNNKENKKTTNSTESPKIEKRGPTKSDEKTKRLSEILLNNSLDLKTEYNFEKDDVSKLFKVSSDLKEISENISNLYSRLDRIINKPEQGQQSKHKDVVNYHVIEITENKANQAKK